MGRAIWMFQSPKAWLMLLDCPWPFFLVQSAWLGESLAHCCAALTADSIESLASSQCSSHSLSYCSYHSRIRERLTAACFETLEYQMHNNLMRNGKGAKPKQLTSQNLWSCKWKGNVVPFLFLQAISLLLSKDGLLRLQCWKGHIRLHLETMLSLIRVRKKPIREEKKEILGPFIHVFLTARFLGLSLFSPIYFSLIISLNVRALAFIGHEVGCQSTLFVFHPSWLFIKS